MEKTYTIEFNFKMSKIIQKTLTILIVITSIVFCYGLGASAIAGQQRDEAEKERIVQELSMEAVEKIEIVIANKTNRYAYTSSVKFDFSFIIKNNNNIAVNYIEGIFQVKDCDGNVLSYGTAYFGTTMTTTERGYKFPQNSEQTYTLTWEEDMTDGAIEIWNSEYSDLEFSFEITKIRLENNSVIDVKSNP